MIKLNLGSGFRPKDGYINIDVQKRCKPDILCDIAGGLPFLRNEVDEIQAIDFLEHIPLGKTIAVIEEIWRVLKHDGLFESLTPDAQRGQGAFQDPTHVSFWVANSWLYYSHPAYRKLYDIKANFKIESMEGVRTGEDVYHIHVMARAIKNDD